MSNTKVQAIHAFVVAVPSSLSIDEVKRSMEKDMNLHIVKIDLVSAALSIFGPQARTVYQDPGGPFTGRSAGDGTSSYAITALADITEGLDFVAKAESAAAAIAAEKAKREAEVETKRLQVMAENARVQLLETMKQLEEATSKLQQMQEKPSEE